HQPARLHVPAVRIDRRQAAFLDQRDNQPTVRAEIADSAHDDRVRPLVRDFCEYALKLSRRRLREHHADDRSLQLSTCLTKQLLPARGCARRQIPYPGCRWDGFLEDLQTLAPNLVPGSNGDAGDVASRVCEACGESGLNRVSANPDDRCCGGRRAGCPCRGGAAVADYIPLWVVKLPVEMR